MYLVSRIHIYLQYYRCALLFASSLLLSRTRLEVASRIRLGQVECERATSTKGELINSRLYRLTLPLTGALRWTLQTLRFLFQLLCRQRVLVRPRVRPPAYDLLMG